MLQALPLLWQVVTQHHLIFRSSNQALSYQQMRHKEKYPLLTDNHKFHQTFLSCKIIIMDWNCIQFSYIPILSFPICLTDPTNRMLPTFSISRLDYCTFLLLQKLTFQENEIFLKDVLLHSVTRNQLLLQQCKIDQI